MAGSSAYPVVVHQTVPSKDAASVNSMATRSSAAQSSHSSITSEDSYISSESSSMWSSQEAAALIEGSKSRINRQTGQMVTVWNQRS